MNIDLTTSKDVYHLLTQTIIPRPIAWVLTENSGDSLNLAPFSYFNAVSSDPPLFMLSMGKKPDGRQKDSAKNLQVGSSCVVHIAHTQQSEQVTNTAANLEYGESEIDANQIELTDHEDWPLPRVSDCPIAYLCEVHSTMNVGNAQQEIIFLEAKSLYVTDRAVNEISNRIVINAEEVNPLARLGAAQYSSLGDVFSKARPK